jgi:hypothetical protein
VYKSLGRYLQNRRDKGLDLQRPLRSERADAKIVRRKARISKSLDQILATNVETAAALNMVFRVRCRTCGAINRMRVVKVPSSARKQRLAPFIEAMTCARCHSASVTVYFGRQRLR